MDNEVSVFNVTSDLEKKFFRQAVSEFKGDKDQISLVNSVVKGQSNGIFVVTLYDSIHNELGTFQY